MFKKIKASIASIGLISGLGLGGIAAVTYIAPAIAHADSGNPCSSTTDMTSYEDNVWITSEARSNPYNTLFASDSYSTFYPSQVAASPSGSYYYFGKWDICWDNEGTNEFGQYGLVAFNNQGAGGFLAMNSNQDNILTAQGAGPDEAYHGLFLYQCYGNTGGDPFQLDEAEYGYPVNFYSSFNTPGHGTIDNTEVAVDGADTYDLFNDVGSDNNPVFCSS